MSSEERTPTSPATHETAAEISQQWLDLASTSKDNARDTVHEFVQTVERIVPSPAQQREIIESWLQMAQTMVHAQSDALRSILHNAVNVNVNVDTNVHVDPEVSVDVPTNVTVASKTGSPPPDDGADAAG